MRERKRSVIMRRAEITVLITVVLTTAFLAATWKAHAQPSAGYIEVINSASSVVWGPSGAAGSFAAAVAYCNTYSPTSSPYHILAGQGFSDTLSAPLTITANGLWIIGAPAGLLSPTNPVPKINLLTYAITVSANNVFIMGLDITGSPNAPAALLISGSSNTIENDTIIGAGAKDGIYATASPGSSNDFIANNTISDWDVCIVIAGSSDTVELNTLNTYYTTGIDASALGSGNMIWWNNCLYTHQSAPYAIMGTYANTYDSMNKGNFYNGGSVPPWDLYPLSSPAKPIPGDINLDGVVNMLDVGILASAWLHGLPSWWWRNYWYDPRVDLLKKGLSPIQYLFDLIIIGRHWLWSDPPSAMSAVNVGAVTTDPSTTVSVSPATTTALVGQTITVNITVSTVSNLVGWMAGITFNPNVLTCLSVQEGPFLSQEGTTVWIAGTINNTTGTLGVLGCALCGSSTVNGGGTLATARFWCSNTGSSELNLTSEGLANSTLQVIPSAISNSQVTVSPAPTITSAGGTVVPVNKLALLVLLLATYVPSVGLASTAIVAVAVAAAIYFKRVKRRQEKQ